jgi:tRNA (mo5U34)-methyltransferase
MAASPDRTASTDPRAAIASVPSWYHTIEVAPGLLTPGEFDLRPVVERLPWPDVRGKRCLDVGTYDGFLAFELERRGASEVLATDLPSYEHWDWELHQRELGPEYMRVVAGGELGAGARVARELRGSSVRFEPINAYALDPELIGRFDVVVCGSLLLHLRDPVRALEAIRSVCDGVFLCTNHLELGLTVAHPRRPVFRLDGTSGATQWWLANAAGNRQLLRAGGFEMLAESRPYSVPFGPGHLRDSRRTRAALGRVGRIALTGSDGVPHHALLCRPAIYSTGER